MKRQKLFPAQLFRYYHKCDSLHQLPPSTRTPYWFLPYHKGQSSNYPPTPACCSVASAAGETVHQPQVTWQVTRLRQRALTRQAIRQRVLRMHLTFLCTSGQPCSQLLGGNQRGCELIFHYQLAGTLCCFSSLTYFDAINVHRHTWSTSGLVSPNTLHRKCIHYTLDAFDLCGVMLTGMDLQNDRCYSLRF